MKSEKPVLRNLRIDIISDVMCPWCVIGYLSLQQALVVIKEEVAESLKKELQLDIHWQPFELNPNMPTEGQALSEHMLEKYAANHEQRQASREYLIKMGQSLGFEFNFQADKRILNTFSAHQLLLWTEENSDQQGALMMALFKAYFTENRDVSDVTELLAIVAEVGLDAKAGADVLTEKILAEDVRILQQQWYQLGITAVPTFIIDEKYMISGGQKKEAFIQGLRQILLTEFSE